MIFFCSLLNFWLSLISQKGSFHLVGNLLGLLSCHLRRQITIFHNLPRLLKLPSSIFVNKYEKMPNPHVLGICKTEKGQKVSCSPRKSLGGNQISGLYHVTSIGPLDLILPTSRKVHPSFTRKWILGKQKYTRFNLWDRKSFGTHKGLCGKSRQLYLHNLLESYELRWIVYHILFIDSQSFAFWVDLVACK